MDKETRRHSTSVQLIDDFYINERRRMKLMIVFLACMLLLSLGGFLWLKQDTSRSLAKLKSVSDNNNQILHTLDLTNKDSNLSALLSDMHGDHDAMIKYMQCVIDLFTAGTFPTQAQKEACLAGTRLGSGTMEKAPPSANNSSSNPNPNNNNTNYNTKQQDTNAGGGGTGTGGGGGNVITDTFDNVTNWLEGGGRWLGGQLGL